MTSFNKRASTRWITYSLIAGTALWTCQSFAQANPNQNSAQAIQTQNSSESQLSHRESSFIKEAAQGNEMEVQLGKLGEQRAQNQSVKELAQRLEQDHAKAAQQLTQVAQQVGVTVPTQLKNKEDRTMSKLENESGAAFDKAFAEHSIRDHEKDIKKYDKALQEAKDPQLKAYIQQTLPVLRQHLQLSRDAGQAVGVSQSLLSSADKILSSSQGTGAAPASQSASGFNSSNKSELQNSNGINQNSSGSSLNSQDQNSQGQPK